MSFISLLPLTINKTDIRDTAQWFCDCDHHDVGLYIQLSNPILSSIYIGTIESSFLMDGAFLHRANVIV